MHFLKAVFQHGPVFLDQQFSIDVYPVVRIDPHEVRVMGTVVDFAQADAIGDDR